MKKLRIQLLHLRLVDERMICYERCKENLRLPLQQQQQELKQKQPTHYHYYSDHAICFDQYFDAVLLMNFQVNVSESISPNSEVLTLSATDADEDRRLLYTIHTAMNVNSTDYFKIDSSAGTISIAKPIDREAIHQHVLTVMVKDQGECA